MQVFGYEYMQWKLLLYRLCEEKEILYDCKLCRILTNLHHIKILRICLVNTMHPICTNRAVVRRYKKIIAT